MAILKTLLPHRNGREVNLPIVGKVIFSSQGTIEVSDKDAEALLKEGDIGLEMYDPSKKVSKETTTTTTLDPNAPIVYTLESLSKMKSKDLKDVADGAGLPENEWQGLKKDDLVLYLLDKIGTGE